MAMRKREAWLAERSLQRKPLSAKRIVTRAGTAGERAVLSPARPLPRKPHQLAWSVERLLWLHFGRHLGHPLTQWLVHTVRCDYTAPRPQSRRSRVRSHNDFCLWAAQTTFPCCADEHARRRRHRTGCAPRATCRRRGCSPLLSMSLWKQPWRQPAVPSFTASLKAHVEAALADGLRRTRSAGQAVALAGVSRALTGEALPPELIDLVMRRLPRGSEAAETIELQVALRNYNPQMDKRFAGNIRLPHVVRPRLRVCMLGDAYHCEKAAALGIDFKDLQGLRNCCANAKLATRFQKKYAYFLASESVIRHIPRLFCQNGRAGKFPVLVGQQDDLAQRVEQIRSTIKFQLKKVTALNVAVGHCHMNGQQLSQNLKLAVDFLISLLKRGTQNLKTIHIKSTRGPPHRLV